MDTVAHCLHGLRTSMLSRNTLKLKTILKSWMKVCYKDISFMQVCNNLICWLAVFLFDYKYSLRVQHVCDEQRGVSPCEHV